MEPTDFFSFNLTELRWLRERLQNHESLQTQEVLRVRGIGQHTFVRFLGELSLRTGSSTRQTLEEDKRRMLRQLNHRQVTRSQIFFNILREWLERNDSVNLRELVGYCNEIGMRNLADSIEMLYVEYTLPLSTTSNNNGLHYNSVGQIVFRLQEADVDEVDNGNEAAARAIPLVPLQNEPAIAVATNSLVLSHIFSYLNLQTSRENFRMASSFFLRMTLQEWRNSSTFQVYSHEDVVRGICHCTLGLREHRSLNFASLLQLVNPPVQNDQNGEDNETQEDISRVMQFQRYPVKNLYVSYRRPRTTNHRSEYTPLFSNPGEIVFWRDFGMNLIRISLCCLSVGRWVDSSTQRQQHKLDYLLVDACPNLQYLEINHVMHDSHVENMPPQVLAVEAKNDKKKKTEDAPAAANQMRINTNIRTLSLNLWHAPHYVSYFLSTCPNVNRLHTDSPSDLEGLLEPTQNGQRIQLDHLELLYGGDRYTFLHDYIVQFPATLRVINFHSLELDHVRSDPFVEYGCIGKCTNLSSLRINFRVPMNVLEPWYYDLSAFQFENVQELKISFSRTFYRICVHNMLRFDLHTIKKFPSLVSLNIDYNGWNADHRRAIAGPQDEFYFYNGPRNNYVPADVQPIYPDLNAPLLCVHLRKVAFTCWALTPQDVTNFFNWFPRLTHLHIRANRETLAGLIPFATRLKKLLLVVTGPTSLRYFRQLQERKPTGLTILTKNINNEDNEEAVYQVLVRNERISFQPVHQTEWTLN